MAKRLVLMHGAPGSGKSTFIKKLGLEYITISPDTIRLLFSEPKVMEVDHHSCMQFSRKYDKEVWELIFKALEERMKNGSDTVIDACNFTQDFIERYKSLADPYDFHIIALDFSSLPLDVLLKQNKQRLLYTPIRNRYAAGLHYTPEHLVRDRYQRMEPIPNGIYIIDATAPDAEEEFWKIWRELEA